MRRAVSLASTVFIALALALAAVVPAGAHGVAVVRAAADHSGFVVVDGGARRVAAKRAGRARVRQARGWPPRLRRGAWRSRPPPTAWSRDPTTDMALIETPSTGSAPGGGDAAAWPRARRRRAPSISSPTGPTARTESTPPVTVHTVFEPADQRRHHGASKCGRRSRPVAPAMPTWKWATTPRRRRRCGSRVTRGGVEALDREFDMGPSRGDAAGDPCAARRRCRAAGSSSRRRRMPSRPTTPRSPGSRARGRLPSPSSAIAPSGCGKPSRVSRRARDVHGAGEMDRRGRRGSNRPGHLRPLGPDRAACRASPALCASRGDALADRW